MQNNNSKHCVTIKDFPDYRISCRGYIRSRTFRYSQDIETIMSEFENYKFNIPEPVFNEFNKWINYQTHIFLMSYFKDNIKVFYRLYIELVDSYNYFYTAEINYFQTYYPEQIVQINDFTLTYLKTLAANGGYPNRVLCYCYKNLLEDYNQVRIVNELLSMDLDNLLNLFIEKFSAETEISSFYISYLFMPVRYDLNEKLDDLSFKYGNFADNYTRIVKDILYTRTGSTMLKNYFSVDQKDKSQIITMWCKRVGERIIKHTLSFLKDDNNYIKCEA